MVNTFRVRGAKKFQAKIQDIKLTVRDTLLKSALQDSYDYGLRIIPRDTGKLRQGFQIINRKKTGTIRQLMPVQNRQNPRPYHLWLYGTGNTGYMRKDGSVGNVKIKNVQAGVRSGRYDYMKRVRDHLPRRVKKRMKDVVNKRR